MKWNPAVMRFLKEETGQTTVEYILMLAVVVTIFMQMRSKLMALVKKILGKLDTTTTGVLDDMDSARSD
jgi:Flp pilus assembly pilin Flp